MGVEREPSPQQSRTPEEVAAEAIAAELTDGSVHTTTLRALRDAHLDGRRLTLRRRLALEQALVRARVGVSRPLAELHLDELLTLVLTLPAAVTVVRPGRARRLAGWLRRSSAGGVRRTVATVTVVASLVAIATAVVEFWPLLHPRGPALMSGDFDLAVAGFAGSGGAETDGRLLAASVTRSLEGGLVRRHAPAADADVQVREELRSFPADEHASVREQGARQLAAQIGADVVIYGRIVRHAGRTRVEPELYIDPQRLTGAEELGGVYALPAIDAGYLSVNDAVAARASVRVALSRQMRALSAFASALSRFDLGHFARSRQLLLSTLHGSSHTVVLAGLPQLFLGNADGKLGRLREAGDAYAAALRSPQVRERARLGLTELALHHAQAGCGPRTRAAPLLALVLRYRRLRAGAASSALPGQALALRAELGEARVDLCLSQARLADRWLAATRLLHAVLAAGAGSPDRYARELAEAHAGLGLALLPAGPAVAGAAVRYRRARAEYRRAANLAVDTDRGRVFDDVVHFIDGRLASHH